MSGAAISRPKTAVGSDQASRTFSDFGNARVFVKHFRPSGLVRQSGLPSFQVDAGPWSTASLGDSLKVHASPRGQCGSCQQEAGLVQFRCAQLACVLA